MLLTSESPSLIVVARSQDLPLDTGAILKKLIERFGGKGGGKGAMAQGGGLDRRAAGDLSMRREKSVDVESIGWVVLRPARVDVDRPRNEPLGITQRNIPAHPVRNRIECMLRPRKLQQY